MFTDALVSSALAIAVGWLLKSLFEDEEKNISNREFWISATLIIALVAPLTVFLGYQVAINNNITYRETNNGWELKAKLEETTCHRDGICHWDYQCDPYVVTHTYTDSKGVSHTTEETHYHDCPYLSSEWRLALDTTVGEVLIAPYNAPTDPQHHRYRAWVSVPDRIPSGIPPSWAEAKARLDAGSPGPVAVRKDYINYILASHSTLLHQYSDRIEEFRAAGLLPKFNYKIVHDYLQDRIYWMGLSPTTGDWMGAINRFNAAFGSQLQGDLHLVLVPSDSISEPDAYINSLAAYWQSKDFGKDAFSKNGLVVAVGVKDGVVAWARGATGMPKGNEGLLQQLRFDLKGTAVTPEALLGMPAARLAENQVTYDLPQGKLGQIIWGENKFVRVCMKCKADGEEQNAGFAYLLSEVKPTSTQKFLIVLAVVLVSGVIWFYVLEN